MKLKKLSLLAGAIAVAFSITPLAANAQANSNVPQRVAQANRQGPQLNLSPQQKEQLAKIQSNARDQIQNVFTPPQRKQIQTGLQAGKPPQQVFASIQFSQQQQTQLADIMKDSQTKMVNVLNAQQKEELKKWQASQRSQRQRK